MNHSSVLVYGMNAGFLHGKAAHVNNERHSKVYKAKNGAITRNKKKQQLDHIN